MMSIVLAVLAVLLFALVLRRKRKGLRLPPGPLGLPVVGYLPWIDPKKPHETLTDLTKKYGPICGLRMGSIYTVLLSDPRLVKQAFSKDTFTARAPLYLTHGIMQGYGLICAEGELWRDQRKFVVRCLKNFGMVKFGPKRDRMEKRILDCVEECLSKLKERSTDDGFDCHDTLQHSMGNLLNDLVFGKTYAEDDEMWRWLRHVQEEGVKHIGIAGPLNFLPFLRFLPRYGNTMRYLTDGQRNTHEIYRKIVEDHRRKAEKTESFLAAFDDEMTARKSSNDPGHFTEPQIYYLLADLFGAGTDTTLTTLRWFLLFMAIYPDEQRKIREEMQQVLAGRKPTLEDRNALTRLEAAIAEVQRLRSVVPVGIPHGTTEDTQINEYDIPKGSMIVPIQWAIHTNPLYWRKPHEFRVERFITDDGSLAKPEAFIPFQTGKRMCVGEELARMALFLFASRILHAFEISTPPGIEIDIEGECGITLVPKPHRLIFTSY